MSLWLPDGAAFSYTDEDVLEFLSDAYLTDLARRQCQVIHQLKSLYPNFDYTQHCFSVEMVKILCSDEKLRDWWFEYQTLDEQIRAKIESHFMEVVDV